VRIFPLYHSIREELIEVSADINVSAFLEMIQFFTTLILNADEAEHLV
jgi:hypothetical protein